MKWLKPIIKVLAYTTLPAKLIDKGLDHAKNNIREEIEYYEDKMKLKLMFGSVFLLLLVFISVTAAMALGQVFDNLTAGFAVMSGVYLIVLIILFIIKKEDLLEKR